MKQLHLEKHDHQYFCKDQDTIVYRGIVTHTGNTYQLDVQNAFADLILSISYSKAGFHLFRSAKTSPLQIRMYGKEGVLTPQERTYTWQCNGVSYIVVCGERSDAMDVILRDQNDTLGYVEGNVLMVKDLMYSAELSAIWMVMQERRDWKERVFMEPDKFERAMKEAKAI